MPIDGTKEAIATCIVLRFEPFDIYSLSSTRRHVRGTRWKIKEGKPNRFELYCTTAHLVTMAGTIPKPDSKDKCSESFDMIDLTFPKAHI